MGSQVGVQSDPADPPDPQWAERPVVLEVAELPA